jgi:glycerol kinase
MPEETDVARPTRIRGAPLSAAILALDQGTTGSTARVFDAAGRVLAGAYAEFTQHYPQAGWVEHDPEELWRVSRDVLARALAEAKLAPGTLSALGLTNQRETTLVWERASGRPIHPAIVWQSRQSADVCARLRAGGHTPWVRERTGLVLDPYFSGSKLTWLLDHYDPERRRAASGEWLFGTVDTWLLWKLTGGRVHATDPTNAARTLLYDIHRRTWDDELLALFGVPRALLPEVRPSAGDFGSTACEGLPSGVPIRGVAGDQQAALFGQGCWEPGSAKNTYGTGCFLVLNTGARAAHSQHGLITTLACDAQGAPVFALEGSVFVAGAAVQWLRDELGLVASAAETEALAASVPDTQGVYVVPAFAGLGAPYWDSEARGGVLGLTRGTNRRHLVRATLESLAYQTRDVVEAMNADAPQPLATLRVDGGAAANDFLMQFQADVLGVPVERPASIETTVAGAAHLAALGIGLPRSPSQAGAHVAARRFEPSLDPDTRERLYAGWRAAVERVRTRD